jgi:hypothetical protein
MYTDIGHKCGSKKRHLTKDIAEQFMKSTTKKEERHLFDVYLYSFCHYWHIGHAKGINKWWEKTRRTT